MDDLISIFIGILCKHVLIQDLAATAGVEDDGDDCSNFFGTRLRPTQLVPKVVDGNGNGAGLVFDDF